MIYYIAILVLVALLGLLCVRQDMRIDELENDAGDVDFTLACQGDDIKFLRGRAEDLHDQVEDLQDQLSVLSQTVAENEANNLILDGDVGSLEDKVENNREYMKQHKEIIELILDEFDKDWEYVEGYQLKDKED